MVLFAFKGAGPFFISPQLGRQAAYISDHNKCEPARFKEQMWIGHGSIPLYIAPLAGGSFIYLQSRLSFFS